MRYVVCTSIKYLRYVTSYDDISTLGPSPVDGNKKHRQHDIAREDEKTPPKEQPHYPQSIRAGASRPTLSRERPTEPDSGNKEDGDDDDDKFGNRTPPQSNL